MYKSFLRFLSLTLLAGLLLGPVSALGQASGGNSESGPTLGKAFGDDMLILRTGFSADVRQAGLVDTLQSDGPFTVFVFTNETAEELNKEFSNPKEDPAFRSLMQYHVVPGRKLRTSDLSEAQELQTLEGTPITVESTDEGILLHGKNPVRLGRKRNNDVAGNGIMHVVESALRLPGE